MNPQGANEFEPSIEWVNEDDCDTLLLYLPGFVKEQLKVQLRSRTLIISGQRKLPDNTWTRFRKEFPVAEHCDLNKISAKFEGSILNVKQPKSMTTVAKQEQKPPTNDPNPTPKSPTDEPKVHEEQAKGKHDAKLDGLEKVGEKKDGNYEGRVSELEDSKGGRENVLNKIAGSSDLMMKRKLSRNEVLKVLALVFGFVVGYYCAKSIESWIV